jgi:hypothetical protein
MAGSWYTGWANVWEARGWYESSSADFMERGFTMSPSPDRCVVKMTLPGDMPATYAYDVRVIACPYTPEVHAMRAPQGATTTIDGSTTITASLADNGYVGLPQGVWANQFIASEAQLQTLADNIAKINGQERPVVRFATKMNPKYDPWDIFAVTYFTTYVAKNFEVIGIRHTWRLGIGAGGAETVLTMRRWPDS